MAEAVYLLCLVTSCFCAVLLWRQYCAVRTRLLLWSSMCFAGLAGNNVMLFVDKVLTPQIDMSLLRAVLAFASVTLMLIGLVSESR
jgi:hypothetical protein